MNEEIIETMFVCLTLIVCIVIMAPDVYSNYHDRDPYEFYIGNESPSPGERVNVSVQSLDESLRSIRAVEWYVDGESVKEFRNKTSMNEVVNGAPKRIKADIVYFSSDGERKHTSITRLVRPIMFDILWEGDVVTTPSYRGHKLAGPQTPVRLSAHIQYIDENGALHTEKDFSFIWEVESIYQDERGAGVSAITYEKGGTFLNNYLFVRARASLISGGLSVERFINVPIIEPLLLVYPYTLLNGLSYNATVPKNYKIIERGNSVTLSVYPFYFSRPDFDKNRVQYKWFVNNKLQPLKKSRKIDISVEGNLLSIPLKIFADNENKKQQKIQNSITLNV